MNAIRRTFVTLFAGVAIATLGGCATSRTVSTPTDAAISPAPATRTQPAAPPDAVANTTPASPNATSSTPAAPNTIPVKVYKADVQCAELVPTEMQVTRDRSLEAAVGEVINANLSPADFKLAGYRVNVNESGVATVDLRMAPDSPRPITSLSSCEQFALFGSLRETLTDNAQWQVQSVRFTERGEEIIL